MKKTILFMILISLGVGAFAQPNSNNRRDDNRRTDNRSVAPMQMQQPAPQAQRAPAPQVQRAPAPVVVHKSAPVVVHKPAPVVVKHKSPQVVVRKPAPVKFVVKKPKPKPTLFGLFVRAVTPPPPSRAVVIVNASASNPVYEMADLDRQPQLIESPTINYPENMANAGVAGEVTMDVQIDKDGYVGLEKVVSSTNTDFEKEAIASLSTFKYEQPLKGGYPVNTRFTMTIPFEISE